MLKLLLHMLLCGVLCSIGLLGICLIGEILYRESRDNPIKMSEIVEIVHEAGKIFSKKFRLKNEEMSYFKHFGINIKITLKCLLLTFYHLFGFNIKTSLKCLALALFHLAHGIVPIKLTEHKRWGIGGKG